VLAASARRVHAIEIDRQFHDVLTGVAADHANVAIAWGDARTVELPPFDVVVASLPYSTSLPILFRLLEHGFASGAVLLQDRQARRLAAAPGAPGYSRVSVMAQRLAAVEVVAHVPRDRFVPEPAVDSALVRLAPHTTPEASDLDWHRNLLDTLFLHRSKTLEAALRAGGLAAARDRVPARLRNRRVDRLTPDDFDAVAAAARAAGLAVPPVPARVKRRR
jgi:16S rRNA (adenine1518-N6/adenine1519-N6)-dimethyltransferase